MKKLIGTRIVNKYLKVIYFDDGSKELSYERCSREQDPLDTKTPAEMRKLLRKKVPIERIRLYHVKKTKANKDKEERQEVCQL